ncbi:MAG: flavin reductase family protein [Ancalomicrobiaceae bacterium]|nr:flavin reductase family protein [Ancalomicrobiaceae bacterium]
MQAVDLAPSAPISADIFRAAMRQFVGTVSLITVGTGDERSGLVATSAGSLSADPPLVLVCVNRQASSWPLFARHAAFGVNFLRPHHRALAERFSGRDGTTGSARYDGADWRTMVTGAPLLKDAAVAFDCELDDMFDKGSHSVVIGRVMGVATAEGEDALVYWRGGYRSLTA